MQLIGQAVKHVSWGKGIITSFDKSGHIVSVLFALVKNNSYIRMLLPII